MPAGRGRAPAVLANADESLHLLHVERLREQEPLSLVAALALKLLELAGILDALGERLDVERLAELDERMDDRRGFLGGHDLGDERPVDLQRVRGELAQVGERAGAGAEVVDRDSHAERLDLPQPPGGCCHVAHQRRLGDLERERRGLDARFPQHPTDVLREPLSVELVGGDVDRHADAVAPICPLRGLAGGLLQHPTTDRRDPPGLLGERDEVLGLDHAARGVPPAQERLDAHDLLARQLEDRLIEQEELPGLQGVIEVHLERQALFLAALHVRLEQHRAVLAVRLCAVEGQVGVPQQLVGRLAVADRDPDADAAGDGRLAVVQHDRLAQRLDHALGDELRRRLARGRLEQHHELVSSQAADSVLVSHDRPQPLADDLQQPIPGGVSEAVVDVLEAIDVDVQGGRHHARLAPRPREHPLGAVERQCAVRQPCESVVQRLVGELSGLIAHHRQRPSPSRPQDEHQQTEQPGQREAAEQQRQRFPVDEHASAGRGRGGPHRPAVAEVDRR